MARRHYWQFLVTDEGNPIENANITIFIAGTSTPAYVYASEVGGTVTNGDPQTVTSRKGYFEFWVADTTELNGYFFDTKFKIAWSAPGVSAGHIDYVDVFSTSVAPVDETSTDTLKNKAVSNFLAKGWEDHKDSIMFVDSVTSIHGITLVDETGWNGLDTENSKYNKLINNVDAHNWESHTETIYLDGSDPLLTHLDSLPVPLAHPDGFYYNVLGGVYFPVGYEIDGETVGGPGNPHGIEQVTITSTDTEKNKLVSNAVCKLWEDHRTDNSSDVHTQYPLVTGTKKFTGPTGYSDGVIVGSAGPNDFITKAYVGLVSGKYSVTVNPGDWTNNGDGTYSRNITHSLALTYPMVITWNIGSTPKSVMLPLNIDYIDTNTVKITVTSAYTMFVRVSG